MGKTFRRDNRFRPRAHGKTFDKDQQPWKKKKKQLDNRPPIRSEDITQENFGS